MIAPRISPRVRAFVLAVSTGLLLTTASSVALRGTQAPAPPGPVRAATASEASERAAVAARQEVRALWVTRSSLATPEQIGRLVRDARDSGFNTLLVQVRGRGDAWFTQGLEPRPEALANSSADFDPLAQTLTQAHAAGLRVHAWINVNLISSAVSLPRDRAHIVHAHPEWLMVPRALGRELARMNPRSPAYVTRLAAWARAHDTTVEGLYSSPILPDSARHLEGIVDDLAKRYAIDGLHMDYLRYPTAEFDYSATALAAFRATVVGNLTDLERARLDARQVREPLIYADTYPKRWADYRRARLSDLVARIRTSLKKQRPNALLTAAVKPDALEAANQRMQDWQDWAARGLLDAICPMAYTDNVTRFSQAVTGATRSAAPQPLWAGIGAYRLDQAQTVAHIQAARAAGARGIALFSYDSLTRPALRSIGRTAFGEPGTPVASAR
jgi:uncharacterized lipoprotein YddW (UPF0748 family)